MSIASYARRIICIGVVGLSIALGSPSLAHTPQATLVSRSQALGVYARVGDTPCIVSGHH